MTYSAAAILALASQCAPSVAPETVLAIIQTESSGEPFALNVNGGRQPARQANAADAAATARRYVAAGYSVDLGLGQINSRNMRWLGLTWETVFDPCTNVAALARVLTTNYNAVSAGRDPQTARRVALSMYNTGSQTRGFRNGYVAKVVSNAGVARLGAPDPPTSSTDVVTIPTSGDLRLAPANAFLALGLAAIPPCPAVIRHRRLHAQKTTPAPERGWAAKSDQEARRDQAHLQGCNRVKDPACRVAPERDGPSRKRRPSPSSGTATKTPAHPRRPKSVEYH
jgi:type IV secretion system protein VirB1